MKPFDELLSVEAMATVRADAVQMLNIRERLTLRSTNESKPFVVKLYENHNDVDKILVPRSVNAVLEQKMPITELEIWKGLSGTDRATPKMRPEQKAIVQVFLDRVKSDALYGGIVKSPTGCVDCETEYLTPEGWKRFDDYTPGDKVAQYHSSGTISFVIPTSRVVRPASKLWHLRSKYGIDQMLSSGHRVVYKTDGGYLRVRSAFDVVTRHNQTRWGFEGKFITTFDPPTTAGFPLSSWKLRLQVAVHADGHLNGNLCYMNLLKRRKILRLKELLVNAKIPFKKTLKKNGFTLISFKPPLATKTYGPEWWGCSGDQLNTIANEAIYWDGSCRKENKGPQFFSCSKTCADFIQYSLSASGWRASLKADERAGRNTTYNVKASRRILPSLASATKKDIKEVPTLDGKMYCFEVETGMLLLRRNGNIFVTGNTGKTVMGIAIAYALGYRTLIVVPTDYLMKQWHDRLIQWAGLESKSIGTVRQDNCDFTDKPFTVAMLHSLVRRESYPARMYSYFGTVIIDEIHTIGAETFSRVAPMFHSKYRVGLSATPRRKDGMAPVFFAHIGPIISKYGGYVAVPRIRGIIYNGEDASEYGLYGSVKQKWAKYLNRISKSPSRNLLLAKIMKTLSEREGRSLLLCDRLLIIESVKRILIDELGVDHQMIGLFTNKTKQVDRKIVLGTYGSAGLGADLSDITSLVLATPRSDVVQAVGRALRKGTPTIIDIVDDASPIMKGLWYARRKFYRTLTNDIREPICPRT